MYLPRALLLPLACSVLGASAFRPEHKVEFSVETYRMPEECNAQIEYGQTGLFDYKMFFMNGTIIDSTGMRGRFIPMKVGDEEIPKGFSMGVLNMCVGESRVFITPSKLAFGSRGSYPFVPPHTPLEWHVNLLSILPEDTDFEALRM